MSTAFETELALGRRFLELRPPPGRIVFCALSGAHLYGFPSPDSDLDLKGAYLAPTHRLLGLRPDVSAHDLTEDLDGVECDLTALEIGKWLELLLGGNGNAAEQLFAPAQLHASPELEALRALAPGALSRRFAGHYRGFLKGLRREFEDAARPEVKTLLYGYRVAGTGVHLLLEGSVEADVRVTSVAHGLGDVAPLVARKQAGGEHALLDAREKAWAAPVWDELDRRLAEATEASPLPEAPAGRSEIEGWLVALRRSELGSGSSEATRR